MKLYYSSTSPFVRKVLVVAHELSLADQIERLEGAAHPVERDANIVAHNPLGQVPTLLTDEDVALYDSRVICEYLNHLANGPLFPDEPKRRWLALNQQALSDGILAAALAIRYEYTVRPEEKRFDKWVFGQAAKITDGLSMLAVHMQDIQTFWDIGTISVACMISYLDLRFPEIKWRDTRPALARWYAQICQRPSMETTILAVTPPPPQT